VRLSPARDRALSPAGAFIAAARALVPGISGAEIARRIGISRAAVSQCAFSAEQAVIAWNQCALEHGHGLLRYVPPVSARVETTEETR